MVKNPLYIVDDDKDDIELIQQCIDFLKVDRPVRFFRSGAEFIEFVETNTVAPFLILCDVNLPGMTGFEVKAALAEHPVLRYASVPFIFWSTASSEKQIQYAYDLPAQGYFVKPYNFQELCDTFQMIIGYWEKSQHPKKMV